MKNKFVILISLLLYCALAQNCLKCKTGACTNNICTNCEQGFSISSMGQCGLFTPIEGCRIYDVYFSNKCFSCQNDRYLLDGRCILKPLNCKTVDEMRQCIQCNSGFLLVRGKCFTQNVQNCPLGSLPSTFGSPFCQPISAKNCRIIEGDNQICKSCEPGYGQPINGRCIKFGASSAPCPRNACRCPPKFFKWQQKCVQMEFDKCLQVRDDGIYCLSCIRGFVAIQGICLEPVKQNDINCNVVAASSDYCTGCNNDYFLNEDALCVRKFNCTSSYRNFTSYKDRCVYNDPRCESVDLTTFNCRYCIQGFQLVNGRCERIACLSYELDRNNRRVCKQVFVGYVLINNTIIRMPNGCLSLVSGTVDQCARCSAYTRNLTLTSNPRSGYVCGYYDQYCTQYNSNGSCIKCFNMDLNDGYILKQRFCYKKAENCAVRDRTDQSKCLTCNANYHLDERDRLCYINIPGCEVYLAGTDCKQCSISYLLYEKKCYLLDQDCLNWDNRGMCRRCSKGFVPYKQACVYYHPYCLSYGTDKVCNRAAAGWSLGLGMNQQQKRYYRQFILRGQAVRNRAGSANLNGLSINVGAGAYSQGAIISILPYSNLIHTKINSVNMFGKIVNCNPGFNKTNNNCIKNITGNCAQYSYSQICIRCNPQFTLNSDFSCTRGLLCQARQQLNGKCQSCGRGFIKMGDQCFKIQNKTTIDRLLLNNSFYNYSFSIVENNVQTNYYIVWPRIFNCKTQRDAFNCQQCFPPYVNLNGVCAIQVQRCVDYTSSSTLPGSCQVCSQDSMMWFGQCRRINCGQFANGTCTSCLANFYYYFGTCLMNQIANCKFSESGTCVLCSYGFYPSLRNTCVSQIKGCLVTNRDTGRCLQCRSGLTLYRQRCVIRIENCLDYDQNNRCILCRNDPVVRTQRLQSGEGCALLQGQCRSVNEITRQCQTCNVGFTMIVQEGKKLCANIRANCRTYDTRGRCTVCNQRYVLQNNRCNAFLYYCLEQSKEDNTCVSCAAPAILQRGCCKLPDPQCIDHTPQSCLCTKCMTGYFLNFEGICKNNPNNCDIFDSVSKRCLKCSNTFYYYEKDGTCVPASFIQNGCQNGTVVRNAQLNIFQCLRCKVGFQLNITDRLCYSYACQAFHPSTRHCISCGVYYKIYRRNNTLNSQDYCIPYFCQSYIPEQAQCSVNISTYYGGLTIITTTRTIRILYCRRVDQLSGKCLQCQNFRRPNPLEQYNICYPMFCKSKTQFNCQQCQFGYISSPNFPGSCVPAFCDKYTVDGRCQVCTPPYSLNSLGLCENRGCCQLYDSIQNTCRQAKKYFTLQNGICSPMNCLVTDSTKLLVCLQCARGYTLSSDGLCRVTNCQQDSTGGDSCNVCIRGFRIQIDPATLKSLCLPNYCDQYASDFNTCIRCKQGYTLDQDKLCRSDNCVQYFPSLVCKTCSRYYRLQNQRCVADCRSGDFRSCQCCQFGFSLNLTSNLCQPSNQFCSRRNALSELCEQCLPGYIVLSGSCIPLLPYCKTPSMLGCIECNPGFQLVDNCRCQARFCIIFDKNGTCSQCHPRFELISGLCKPRDCQRFTQSNWTCNRCFSRFIYTPQGMCLSAYCAQWEDAKSTYCKRCQQVDYFSRVDNFSIRRLVPLDLVDGGCYIKYCRNDPRMQKCTQCFPGYNLTLNGLCQCISRDQAGRCNCPQGYLYDEKTQLCQVNRDPCLLRESKQKCIQCPINYQLPSETQGKCIVLYCKRYVQVSENYYQCQECYPNFSLNANKFCVSNLCRNFVNKTGFVMSQCSSCVDGYIPVNDYCVAFKCNNYILPEGICAQCAQNYQVSLNKTLCLPSNCQVFEAGSVCRRCKKGFTLNGTLCVVMYCSSFNAGKCQVCNPGFSLANGLCIVNNCQNLNENNLCLKCRSGFILTANSTCQRQFCQNDSLQKCNQCTRGFVYDFNINRCVGINCEKYFPSYECEKCVPGFYKQNGTCMDVYCNINQFTKQYRCLKCMNGYRFNKNGLCQPNVNEFCPTGKFFNPNIGGCDVIPITGCNVFSNNKCLFCAEGYYLFNSLCISFNFCKRFSYYYGCFQCEQGYKLENKQCKMQLTDRFCQRFAFNKCVKCIEGYLPSVTGRCVSVPAFCVQVDNTGKCLRCSQGYRLNQNICQANDLNCDIFDNLGRCVRCKNNFFLSSDGLCRINPANCLNTNSNGLCSTCALGFFLQNGRCFKQIEFCRRYIETTEQCAQCLDNFSLQSNRCNCPAGFQVIGNRQCFRLPQNCIQVDQSTLLCVQCAPNYILIANFTCLLKLTPEAPQNCKVYDLQTQICRQCNFNYVLENNICRLCSDGRIKVGNRCFSIISGCNTYESNGQCSQCLSGYALQNGLCSLIQVSKFCQVYQPITGICQKCRPGFNLTADRKQCIINNCQLPSLDGLICHQCIDTFIWSGKQCLFQTQFCLSYFNGRCQVCDSFSTLNQSRCVPKFCNTYDYRTGVCTSCIDRYQLFARRCFLIIIGCDSYTSQGRCLQCARGYNLTNGLCVSVQSIRFCRRYNQTNSLCVQCAPGYALSSDFKLCILVNCQMMDPTGLSCSRCISPFQWTGQVCAFVTDFCLSYSNGYCSSCSPFSVLKDRRCVPNFCASYNQRDGVCQSCIQGYTLSERRCFLIIVNCLFYSGTGSCFQCQPGYSLANNGALCQANSNPTCFAGSGKTCNRCKHRYFVDAQMCSAYIPYCINIDTFSKCISCCFGSTLVNGLCVKDSLIKYCQSQIGNKCTQCQPNYSYCSFCDSCLPVSPNCQQYNNFGDCTRCIQNFVLLNGVCISTPVGQVVGAQGTCRSGYYLKNGNCYRNSNDLKLFSQARSTNIASAASSSTSSQVIVLKSNELNIIFSILVTSRGQLQPNSSFLLYYRSKTNDPLVCWNSCIPTGIDNQRFEKELVYPIVATQVQVYLINGSRQNTIIDFRIL